MKLFIFKEIRNLTTQISVAKYQKIEASIIKYGCRRPIIIWGDVIIDGHKRYEICKKYGIPFRVEKKNFHSFADAKHWVAQQSEKVVKPPKPPVVDTPSEKDTAVKTFKPLLEMPSKTDVLPKRIANLDLISPNELHELVNTLSACCDTNCLKEFVFTLFAHITSKQDRDATRHLLQQLYNLHYTPTFQERKYGTS